VASSVRAGLLTLFPAGERSRVVGGGRDGIERLAVGVDFADGHGKAEYFSAGDEGTLVCVAAAGIVFAAVGRLEHPAPLRDVPVGIAVLPCAAAVNLGSPACSSTPDDRAGSLTLEADGRHLMADVWTSVGVVAGIAAVGLTGSDALDPLIALVVAANIVLTGVRLMRRSASGLMDHALPLPELASIDEVFQRYAGTHVQFHALPPARPGGAASSPSTSSRQGHGRSSRATT
jgi:cation diffusion facilitator family transporter